MLAKDFADAVHRLAEAGEDNDTGRVLSFPGGRMLLEVLADNVQQGGHLRVWPRGGPHQVVKAHLELQEAQPVCSTP